LEPGDVVVLFTDGVAESSDLAGSEFGTRGVLELIRSRRGDPAHQILEALNEAACSFQSGGPQLDDMTAVVCKVEG
jgi:sigma-B regulation protein RsbU (phosphoserine phosphatase)